MKCPKCGYLGFEAVSRCRNCGYDFSLAEPAGANGDGAWVNAHAADPDLAIRPPASTPQPLDDLALLDAATERPKVQRFRDAGPDLDRVFGDSTDDAAAPPGHDALPLSGSALGDDVPLITRASPPRAPLAVRRSTPEVHRLRAEPPRLASLDLESEPLPVQPPAMQPSAFVREHPAATGTDLGSGEDAEVGARVLAAAIDLLILAAIDIVVLYFTLQICGVTVSDWSVLPKVPLLGFLVVQNVGYLVAFTAGG